MKTPITAFAAPRFALFAVLLLGVAPLPGVAQGAPPAAPAPPEPTVSLDVKNSDLHAVAHVVERQAHVNVLVRDGGKPYRPVSIHLEDTPLPAALKAIAQNAGAAVSHNVDGVYVFSPLDGSSISSEAVPPAPLAQAPINPVALRSYWVPLRYANSEAVLKLMHWDRPSLQANVLPAGVAGVSARPGGAGLVVQATPAGYERVRQIVKILDIPSG